MQTRSRFRLAALLLVPLVLAACDDDAGPDEERFTATLGGASSSATGTADFTIEENGTVGYTINVSGLSGVTMAHIHGPAAAGSNAGVIAWLYPEGATSPGTPTGTVNGQLAQGTLTATQNTNIGMDSLFSLMRTGNSYVNIHTSTVPSGEIRGQILPR